MKAKIPLKCGHLYFLNDRMIIADRSRMEQLLTLIVFFFTSGYGMYNIISFTAAEHPIYYYSGVMALLSWVFATPLLIGRCYRQVLYYQEIGTINIRKMPGGEINANFKLKKGQTRFVYLNNSKENINRLLNKLEELQLELEFQNQMALEK
ncbi:MAG: hypothetical protein HC819_17125 [Cyclobacteriaceae bacterium]|nr:hypothetical protein [Cyclobacteriaceae bacterium]